VWAVMVSTPLSGQAVDPRIAKALSHPLRPRLLQILSERVASPKEMSDELGISLGVVSYHTSILHRNECIELVSTAQRRGATEHYYRAIVRPFLSDEQWRALPPSLRREVAGQTLRDIFTEASTATLAGGFDREGAHVDRMVLDLDAQGWNELSALLSRTLEEAVAIQEASRHRRSEGSAPAASEPSRLALLHFATGEK
jgi:DNA-binding transcriptional ArsR family regulator